MATAIAHTFEPTRRRVLTLVTILAILFGCYGLLSAHQARSATALPKQVWGGINYNGTIQHQKHIASIIHSSTGFYTVIFDRHVDNCSLQVTARQEGFFAVFGHLRIGPGRSPGEVVVAQVNANVSALEDGDFDIVGMCPST
jgi:hypothetical protein